MLMSFPFHYKVNKPPQDSTSTDKYQKLIENLINLKANE